jgi:homoserine dehydrogenase
VNGTQKTKVGMVGMGTVGSGVARLLLEYGDRTGEHAGRPLWLQHVVVQDVAKSRDVQLPAGVLSSDLNRILNDPEISVVALLMGGLEPARTITLKLLEAGKDIVTANKALIAEHGAELFDRARELGRTIAFEASVAGGIPIIANISTCLVANQIESIHAILNGTSNFILTQMEATGASYADAVAEAQKRGYAEADPSMDVDGTDAAQKLGILSHLAFGAQVPWQEIPRRGIDTLDVDDIRYAKELGYRIKLLAVAQLVAGGLELHVSPTLVKIGTPLAEVRGAFNAVRIAGDAVGPVFYLGLGAGQMPTASAVVADLIDTAVGRAAITFKLLELWSSHKPRVMPSEFADVTGRYYLRFMVEDRPMVLAEICGVLGKHGVSIASVLQHEAEATASGTVALVPLVIMTHTTTEGQTRAAFAEIEKLACRRGTGVRMRVHN